MHADRDGILHGEAAQKWRRPETRSGRHELAGETNLPGRAVLPVPPKVDPNVGGNDMADGVAGSIRNSTLRMPGLVTWRWRRLAFAGTQPDHRPNTSSPATR